MDNYLVIAPFALVGLAVIIFALSLARRSTLSARRLDQKEGLIYRVDSNPPSV